MQDKPTRKWKLAQTIELKWWENYLKNKDADAYLEWKCAYWDELLFSLSKYIELPENNIVLDAGCGPAGIFLALKGNQVDAIDPLLDKYQKFPHFQPHSFAWTQFQTIAIEALQETEKYDYIFCMNAINHVNNIERCYDNLVRALKPNGFLIISTDAHRYYLLKKIFQFIPGDILHPVQLDIEEYNQFIIERKLSILQNILYKQEAIFNYYITIAQKK